MQIIKAGFNFHEEDGGDDDDVEEGEEEQNVKRSNVREKEKKEISGWMRGDEGARIKRERKRKLRGEGKSLQ